MKLTSAQVERTLTQFEGEVIPDERTIGSRPRACARVARTMPTRTDHVTLTRGAAALAAVANTLAVATADVTLSLGGLPSKDGTPARKSSTPPHSRG